MLFSITCLDRPDSVALRAATREAHLTYLDRDSAILLEAGPMLDEDDRPVGSQFIVDLPDRAAAEAFCKADPYAEAGLFVSVVVRRYRSVFRDGARTPT